jgi:hypothetical protein
MTVFILPKLKDADLPAPDKAGKWQQYDKTRFESVAKSLDYKAPGDNKKINSVPDMWALPMTLEMPLYNNRHPLRTEAIAQWQGMLAAIALAKLRGFPLKAELLDLNKLREKSAFAMALYQLLPNSGKGLHKFEDKHLWQEVYVWTWNKKAVGITSPTTIIAPAADGNWEGLKWWNSELKRLEAPHTHLSPEEKPLLRAWLNNLKLELANCTHKEDGGSTEIIAKLLGEYAESLQGETDRTDIYDDTVSYFGVEINRGVFKGLNHPLKDKETEIEDSHVLILPSDGKTNNKHLLLIDPYLSEHWGIPRQNIRIHADKTLESLNLNDLRSGKLNGWDNIRWIEPQDLFLPELTFINLENAIPGGLNPQVSQPLVFNKKRISPLIPVNPILLEYFTPTDLMKRLKFSPGDNPNIVRVTLKLRLSGIDKQAVEYQIVKEYLLSEQNIIQEDDIPVVQIYPHFQVKDWHEYYAFYYDRSRNNQSFQIAFTEAREPHTFEDEGKYQVTRLENFPTHINCYKKTQNIGLIILDIPEEKVLTDSWRVGVDFGTSFTNVCIKNNGKVEPLQLDSLHLKVTESDNVTRIYQLLEHFIPEEFLPEKNPLPFATILTQKGKDRSENMRPIYDGRIYIPDPTDFSPEAQWIKTDIKWTDSKLSKLFLKHLALIISALAAKNKIKEIEWSVSYPSAFSEKETNEYAIIWTNLIKELQEPNLSKELQGRMPIQHHAPNQDNPKSFRTESVAIAQYFSGSAEDCALVRSACIDLGGGTSDISIWQKNHLIYQCSVQLAGRHLLSQFLELRPELIAQWFGKPEEEWQDLTNDKFKTKIDILLRNDSDKWLGEPRQTLDGDPEFEGLKRLMAFGIAGLYYYIGITLNALQQEGKYTDLDIPSIYIGGNGSRLLHWIATGGKFNKNSKKLNKLFNRMLSHPSGLDEVDIPTRLSQKPKDEVAYGLVIDKTKLTGIDEDREDPLITGECCLLNGYKIEWNGRLKIDGEDIKNLEIPTLDRLKEFVEEFNRTIKDLKIEGIKPFDTYERKTGLNPEYRDKLWKNTEIEVCRMLLDIKGDSENIRLEPPFIIGLKALLKVLAKEWADK